MTAHSIPTADRAESRHQPKADTASRTTQRLPLLAVLTSIVAAVVALAAGVLVGAGHWQMFEIVFADQAHHLHAAVTGTAAFVLLGLALVGSGGSWRRLLHVVVGCLAFAASVAAVHVAATYGVIAYLLYGLWAAAHSPRRTVRYGLLVVTGIASVNATLLAVDTYALLI